jgi:hypothetical protein
MKEFKYLLRTIIVIVFVTGFMACSSSTDPYEPYVGNGETIYPSLSDSVALYSGRNRVLIKIAKPVDPHVEKVGIFWRNGHDSLKKAFPQNSDTLRVMIDSLSQGGYTFNIYTYDTEGGKSIGQSLSGKVYGSVYAESILNRKVDLKFKPGAGVVLTLGPVRNQMLGTEIRYKNTSNEMDSLFIPTDSDKVLINNFLVSNKATYTTLYKPSPTNIDTFYTDAKTAAVNEILLVNAENPIMNDKSYGTFAGGKFGTPAHWITNDDARVFPGNKGKNTGGTRNTDHRLGISTFPGPSVLPVNGKIYQTLTLPPGSYYMKVDFGNCRKNYPFYATVAKGNIIPNVNDVKSESLGYALNGFQTVEYIKFKLQNKTKTSYGFVFTIPEHQSSFYVKNVYLYYSPDLNKTFPQIHSTVPDPCPGP